MTVGYKPFEKALYKKFDAAAKKICSEYLISTGKFALDIPLEEQGEAFKTRDFYVTELQTGNKVLCECEVKAVWTKSGEWQNMYWGSIDIPYRKKNSKSSLFFVLNSKLDTLAVIKREDLFASAVGYKNTKNSYTGTRTAQEPFFQVPLSKIAFYYNKLGRWSLVKGI